MPAIELIANAGVALVGWAGWAAAVYFYWQLGRTHELLDRAERAVRRAAHQVRRAGLLTARRRQSMTLDDRLTAAINQSLGHVLARMAEEGVPAGIDAVKCDVSYHTPRGWQPAVEGAVVLVNNNAGPLPEVSRASHSSS